MSQPIAIEGFSDASAARVVCRQSGTEVTVPADQLGLQPLDPTLTAIAGLVGAADKGIYFTGADAAALFDLTAAGRALLDDADAAAQRTTLGLGSAATKELTDWVAYTPTFTGFGTVSSSMWSRRFGGDLQVRGIFVSGTPTAVEARMTLGFGGTSGNVTTSNTLLPSISHVGTVVSSQTGANSMYALTRNNVGYLAIGRQSSASSGLAADNANNIAVSTATFSVNASIPISGW